MEFSLSLKFSKTLVEDSFLSLQCGKSFKKRYTFKMHLLTHIQSLGDSKSVLKTFIPLPFYFVARICVDESTLVILFDVGNDDIITMNNSWMCTCQVQV